MFGSLWYYGHEWDNLLDMFCYEVFGSLCLNCHEWDNLLDMFMSVVIVGATDNRSEIMLMMPVIITL